MLHRERVTRPSSAAPRLLSRADAAEANWIPIRPLLQESMLAAAPTKRELWAMRRGMEGEAFQQAVRDCASDCPTCGTAAEHTAGSVSVLVISQHHSHTLSLPIMCCTRSVCSHTAPAVANYLMPA